MTKEINSVNRPWLVIANPNAGSKRIGHDMPHISHLLTQAGIMYDAVVTNCPGHARELTLEKVGEGYVNFIVVGGDGTLNEVVNGLFEQGEVPMHSFTVAMIPAGSGNDWCRLYHIPADYPKAIEIIVQGKRFLQDAGTITYFKNEEEKKHYFVNTAGTGFDSIVCQKANDEKSKGKKGNMWLYLKCLVGGLISYHPLKVSISFDGHERIVDLFSMTIGVGQYNGGGMRQVPMASPIDGLLTATVISRLSLLGIILNIKGLFDGSFISHPAVSWLHFSECTIRSQFPLMLEADGESLGTGPFHFKTLPKAIHVIVPQAFELEAR